jgi:ubiquinone/menaquinone biosynthesis C-methylase UbiE
MELDKFNKYTKLALTTVYSEPEEGNFHTALIPKVVENFFTPLDLPKESFILDVGCGQGTFMDVLKNNDYTNMIGVTYSKEDVEACNFKNYTTLQCDMSDLTLSNDSMDFIWCRHAIEHSPYPLFTLFEFNRVLKTGGKMYLEMPAPDCERAFEFNKNHYSILGDRMWGALLTKTGFKVLQSSYFEFELMADGKKIPEKYLCFLVEKNESINKV